MAEKNPVPRLLISAAVLTVVWTLYVLRIALGVGPVRDHGGDQAPASHYLLGALSVTAMVAAWHVFRTWGIGGR